jgi:hypothetical protein
MAEAKILIFVHRFSRSVQCQMRVRDEPPGPHRMLSCEHRWTGRPKRKHLADYRRWALYTTQLLADRWNQWVRLLTEPNSGPSSRAKRRPWPKNYLSEFPNPSTQ